MTPSDTTIDYKVCSFLYLYSNFGYNSIGSTCTCRYLNVGINVSQSASPSKLNFRFVGSPIVLHWKGHNSSIRSAIEVNEHLMERLFDKISNKCGPTSISHWQDLQIIETFCRYFCRVLQRRRGLVIHTWDPGPSWSTPQEDGEHPRDAKDVLHLGYHLRRQPRASKPSWRPNSCEVRVHLGLQEQSVVK
jgi:hypothetical protein